MARGKMMAHGWDHWFGFKGTGDAFQFYPTHLWKNEEKVPLEKNNSNEVRRIGVVGNKGSYSPDLFLEGILKFIRQRKDEPFFIYFPTQVPHGRSPADGDQLQVPDLGLYASRDWTHLERLYAAALTRLDTDIGRIVRELKQQGLDDNTLILFTSDNGDENSYYEYTQRFQATGPFRGKKRFLYEGGIRVPMIARWPGKIAPGQTTDTPAAAWDILPTLADLAGTKPPLHADGISLLPLLLGEATRLPKREYLYWEYHQGKQQAVRMGQWKGLRFGGTKEPIELYNLMADPSETRNLAGEHPEVVKRVDAIMEEARAGSPFNHYWPLPERRRKDIQPDQYIYGQLERGIR